MCALHQQILTHIIFTVPVVCEQQPFSGVATMGSVRSHQTYQTPTPCSLPLHQGMCTIDIREQDVFIRVIFHGVCNMNSVTNHMKAIQYIMLPSTVTMQLHQPMTSPQKI